MLSLINILTFAWLALVAFLSLLSMSKGDRRSIHFPIMVHCFFCGIPLLLDEIVGKPEYAVMQGFYYASRDSLTCFIYCAYVSFAPVLMLAFYRTGRAHIPQPEHEAGHFYRSRRMQGLRPPVQLLLTAALVSPLVAAITSPEPLQYLSFSSTLRSQASDVFLDGHNRVALSARLSVLSAAMLVANAKPLIIGARPHFTGVVLPVFFSFLSIWLQGKRSLLALTLVLFLLALHYRGVLLGLRLKSAIIVSIILMLSYSFFFQIHSDRISSSLYDNFRIDYGRDDVIKMTIFAELHPEEMQILEHRGQSFLFHLTTLVPRDLWTDKPLPYAQYLTSAIFYAKPRLWGWGMTTSILEEFIANVGWTGMLLAPLFLAIFCRIGDRSRSSLVKLLTPLLACLLLTVHLTAFYPLFLLWLFLVIKDFLGAKKPIRSALYNVTTKKYGGSLALPTPGSFGK